MMGEKDCLFFWAVEKAPTRDEFTEENKCNLFLSEARAFCWVFQYCYQGVHKRFPVSILFCDYMKKIATIDGQNIIFLSTLIARISAISLPYLRAQAKIKRYLPNRWSKFLPELIFVADNNLGKLRSGDRLCRGGQTRWHRWCLELGQSTEMENSLVRCKNSMWLYFGKESSFSQTQGKYL